MPTPSDSLDALLERARGGDPTALTALGKRFLVGDGVELAADKGIALLREAELRGEAGAAAQLAVCAAWGVAQPRDVGAALGHLQRAAELGRKAALRELELLAGQTGVAPSVLRQRIDLASWTSAPAASILSESPRIIVLERFATVAICQWLIQRGSSGLRPAQIYRGSANPQTAESRTNTETAFTIFNADVVLSLVRDRISAATGAPTANFEIAKVLHYSPGERFDLHADFLEPNTPELVREIQLRGQRAATFLVYLNEGYQGGETEFPRLGLRYKGACGGLRYKGACGDALLFANIDPAGAPDYRTVHAGLPPTQGEKWVLSQWIRTRALS